MVCFRSVVIVVAVVTLLCGLKTVTVHAMTIKSLASSNPLALYGSEIEFDVFRDGERVGKHSVRFQKISSDNFEVIARLDLRVTILTIPVYDYAYHSQAKWKKGRLEGLFVNIDDDGAKSTVRASMQEGKLLVVGPKGKTVIPSAIFPTNHWNVAVLLETRVLNTLSGETSQVKITKQRLEKIRAEGRWIEATKYQYTGDIDTTVWYDDKGRWVKMRFPAKGGSIIEYECTTCGIARKRGTIEERG